jgi:hypothetical protein
MNKDEILDALEDERENMLEILDRLSPEQLVEPGVVGEWSIKDILVHLSLWEAELVKLLWQAGQGQKPTTLHFSKVDVDATNQEWHQNYRDRPFERVFDDFINVRKQTIRRLEKFSEAELSSPDHYPWTDHKALEEWVANDSYQHEAEHAIQIKEWRVRKGI